MYNLIENIHVRLEVKHKYLPIKLQEYLADDEHYVSIGLSPALRLRRRQLYITSPELAVKFVKYFEENISHRKFKSDYRLALIVDNKKLGKHETRWQKEDMRKITEKVNNININALIISKEVEKLESQLDQFEKDRVFILNNYQGDANVNKIINFLTLIKSFGYEDSQKYTSKYTYKKYIEILNKLGFTEDYLRVLK